MKSQGTADATSTTRIPDNVRGGMSPLGGGQPDPYALHRDEEVASAPLERTRAGPVTNNRGFITPIKGRFPVAQGTSDGE